MDDRALWKLMEEVWAHLKGNYRPAIVPFIQTYQVPDFHDWGILVAVLNFEPEQTTTAHLMIRNPFAASEMYLERLEGLQEKGLLEQPTKGKFQLTDRGREAVYEFIAQARTAMRVPGTFDTAELSRIAELLDRLVNGCLEAPTPPNKWSISYAYKIMPSKDESLPFIEQAITCLSAYHDDAYLSAWRQSKLNAAALKVLTLFWNGESYSFDDLCRRLAPLGHPCEVYEGVVKELRQMEYLNGNDKEIYLTALGRLRRSDIEDTAERFFFQAWQVISNEERQQLGKLFAQLHATFDHVRV